MDRNTQIPRLIQALKGVASKINITEDMEEKTKTTMVGDYLLIQSLLSAILNNCKEYEEEEASCRGHIETETKEIDESEKKLVSDLNGQYDLFKNLYFSRIVDTLQNIIQKIEENAGCSLSEMKKSLIKSEEFYLKNDFKTNEKELKALFKQINDKIKDLNRFDYSAVDKPYTISFNGDMSVTFTRQRSDGSDVQVFNMNTEPLPEVTYKTPEKGIAMQLLPLCVSAQNCANVMSKQFDITFDKKQFDEKVCRDATDFKREIKNKYETILEKRFSELFVDESKKAVNKALLEKLIDDDAEMTLSMQSITSDEYPERVKIGSGRFLVTENSTFLSYIDKSPVLNNYLEKQDRLDSATGKRIPGRTLRIPAILDLKHCGNIFYEVAERDRYSQQTIRFVNQIIIDFLVAFPVNRISFCLVDIDNVIGFSQYKNLVKINNGILGDGIVRDDRKLEATIKDVEQRMFKIDEDILSFNNVENILEYNTRFKANQQNVMLLVVANYPAGMRADLNKRLLSIIQNGNKTGIYTLVINNKLCPLPMGVKPEEKDDFIKKAKQNSVVFSNLNNGLYRIDCAYGNVVTLDGNVNISCLTDIIDEMNSRAQKSRQAVVPLAKMFEKAAETKFSSDDESTNPALVLDIPIGMKGAEVQNLLLCTSGGAAHTVVIGGTGSGKSNLLHTIIMSACYKYSPEDLNLYLIDFKGGVEFKYYEAGGDKNKQFPHIRLTGLTSNLEDGVAILSNLRKILHLREDQFRRSNAEDIVAYNEKNKKVPRIVVIVDEIQELFERDELLGQKAIDILSELLKKGRGLGINILWASQNIPHVGGLNNKVLSQIGNRISLKLNNPNDAAEIGIDVKAVKNLIRPEKGLGVINDERYGNDSIEFRVAYAEKSENRGIYADQILRKWGSSASSGLQPLFIVGNDSKQHPEEKGTKYCPDSVSVYAVPKAFENYQLQIGTNYITGEPYNLCLNNRKDRDNVLFTSGDIEMLRDLMGYSLLSAVMENATSTECVSDNAKIFYANGEIVTPHNSKDLYNIIKEDYKGMIENASGTENIHKCLYSLYTLYLQRKKEIDAGDSMKMYAPCYVFIHMIERYSSLFSEKVPLNPSPVVEAQSPIQPEGRKFQHGDIFSGLKKNEVAADASKEPAKIDLANAFLTMLSDGGKMGIHFVISSVNPTEIQAIKRNSQFFDYKAFIGLGAKGCAETLLSDISAGKMLTNPEVAVISYQNAYEKVRPFRFEPSEENGWYKQIVKMIKGYGK